MSVVEMNELVVKYGGDLYRFCIYLTGNRCQADDLYQDTFVKVIQLCHRLDYSGNVKSYLMGIALNLWKNHVRKEKRREMIAPQVDYGNAEIFIADDCNDPLWEYMENEIKQALHKAVRNLPEKQRIAVIFYYMESLPVSEIAKILHIPKGTVLSRLAKARENLKKELEGHGYEV